MTGHVFHPGHAELHGITVVVEARGGRLYLGRYDSEDSAGVHLLDVGTHDLSAAGTREEYLQRSIKYGIKSRHKHVIVPADQVLSITRLSELSRS